MTYQHPKKRILFTIENMITEEFWYAGRWVRERQEAQSFPSLERAEVVAHENKLEGILGLEVVEYEVVNGQLRRLSD